MITLKMGEVPAIPDKFKCPICGNKLTLEIGEWEQNDDGSWQAADSLYVSCVSEPDIESNDWNDWFNSHFSTPYIDWLPVQERLHSWLEKNYRFAESLPTKRVPDAGDSAASQALSPQSGESTPEVNPAATQRR